MILLAGCATDPSRSAFLGEAGAPVDYGGFGNATMNNVLIQSGQRAHAISLGQRFAAEVPTTINFAFDSAVLDAEARRVLDAQAAWIRQFPEVRFAVYGHTDAVGSEAYNHDLGLRRARAAVAYLVSRGVDASRLQALVSQGETQPLVPTPGPERANRRTVTAVSGFVQGHPNVLNGKYAEIVFREYVNAAVPTTSDIVAPATEVAGTQP
nr:OmpA family protein [Rubellimicrobium thermophilum]